MAGERDLVSGEDEQPPEAFTAEQADAPYQSVGSQPATPPASKGHITLLPRRLAESLHLPAQVRVFDPQFSRHSHRYLIQAGLAAMGMLAILVFVDSLSDAALAAGLGSSVVIVFIHPSSHAAQARSVIGGRGLAILVGSALSLVLFAAPVADFLEEFSLVRDLSLALSVGVLILVMAVTNTEHPPAAGIVLGFSTREWDPSTMAIIIAAVLLLALIKKALNSYLRDLI